MTAPHLPDYAGPVIRMVDRLRAVGIEPSAVELPMSDMPDSLAGIATFYGLPVAWTTESVPAVRIEVR